MLQYSNSQHIDLIPIMPVLLLTFAQLTMIWKSLGLSRFVYAGIDGLGWTIQLETEIRPDIVFERRTIQ